MEKKIKIFDLHDPQQYEEEKAYWKSKTPEQRIEAAEKLRQNYLNLKGDETEQRLQRVYRITEREQS